MAVLVSGQSEIVGRLQEVQPGVDFEEEQAALGFQIGGDASSGPPRRIVIGPANQRRIKTNLRRNTGGHQQYHCAQCQRASFFHRSALNPFHHEGPPFAAQANSTWRITVTIILLCVYTLNYLTHSSRLSAPSPFPSSFSRVFLG